MHRSGTVYPHRMTTIVQTVSIDALSIIMSHNILVLQAMAVHYINSIEGGALHQKPNMHLLC